MDPKSIGGLNYRYTFKLPITNWLYKTADVPEPTYSAEQHELAWKITQDLMTKLKLKSS